jgi:hypothetical protein
MWGFFAYSPIYKACWGTFSALGGSPCIILPGTGREKKVLVIKLNVKESLRFQGNKDTQRAIVQ